MSYSNYAACAGTWYHLTNDPARLRQLSTQDNGVAFANSDIRFADVRDGMGQTLLSGERGHGLLEGHATTNAHWWFDGYFGDTLFWTLHPINPGRFLTVGEGTPDEANPLVNSASSFHAKGANFAFVDGSVRFLRESIDSWPLDPARGMPLGVTGNWMSYYQISSETRPGIYQSLSTRSGGEMIDSFDEC